jgi:hypothetical protein
LHEKEAKRIIFALGKISISTNHTKLQVVMKNLRDSDGVLFFGKPDFNTTELDKNLSSSAAAANASGDASGNTSGDA